MASTKARQETTTKPENNNATTKQDAVVIENSPSNEESTANNHPQFQAVGIIKGEVKFHDDEKKSISITIGNIEYGIQCNGIHSAALTGLKKVQLLNIIS